MNRKIQLFSLILGFVLILGATSGTAVTIDQGNSNNVTLETEEFVVNIVGGGQVPMYTFWDANDNTTKYRVMFNSVFEAIDNATDGTQGAYDSNDQRVAMSSLALPSLSWEFSDITEDDNGDVHFDITSTTTSGGAVIQFSNHLYADQSSSIKFDVIVNGYEFKSTESMLVFAFQMQEITEDDTEDADTSQDGDTVSFGDGFFQIEETAEAGNSTIDVGLSTASEEGNSKLYLSYENFDGNDLVHDPTMGVQASSSGSDDDDGGPSLASDESINLWADDISREAAGLSSIFATIVALAIPVTLYRTRN